MTPLPGISVVVTFGSTTISVRQSTQATASATDAMGRPIKSGSAKWDSSDDLIATVNANGVVVGRGPGAATISAKVRGQTGSAVVTVR